MRSCPGPWGTRPRRRGADVVQAFVLWVPVPSAGIRASELDRLLAETLAGRPLRWAITACQPGRLLVEGAVIR